MDNQEASLITFSNLGLSILSESLSNTDREDSKASFDDPDRESFALADKFLCRVSMNEFT
jgi:hypothetical protein